MCPMVYRAACEGDPAAALVPGPAGVRAVPDRGRRRRGLGSVHRYHGARQDGKSK